MVYSPTIIPYDDSVQRSVSNLAREVIKAVDENDLKPGYGIVMIPRLPYKAREEDQLVNYLMKELRQKGIFVSIIHTEVPEDSFGDKPFI